MALAARKWFVNSRNLNNYNKVWWKTQYARSLASLNHLNTGMKIKVNSQSKLKWIHTTSSVYKTVAFKLSDIGEGIREVIIKEWFVKVGDKVQQFDNVCEVQSDKAAVTITSRYDGVVTRLYHEVDQTALVGHPLVDIDTDNSGDEGSSDANSATEPINTTHQTDKEGVHRIKVLTTPAVRRIAAQFKVDLSTVNATGRNGRVLKEDVLSHLNINSDKSNDVPGKDLSVEAISIPLTASARTEVATEDKTVPITGFTRAMVKSMTESLMTRGRGFDATETATALVVSNGVDIASQSPECLARIMIHASYGHVKIKSDPLIKSLCKIPHFGFSDEYDVTKLVKSRESLKDLAQKRGVKLTYMPIIMKAASQGLLQYPILNSSLDSTCENIIYKASHNIGVAMDTRKGLLVPVIKNVQSKSILEIAKELNLLQEKGSKGQLGLSELTGGTFTISNIGIVGGTYTKPVIFSPQVSIGALGKIQVLPRFDTAGNVVKAHILYVSWSADHRVIDGVTMARFSSLLKDYLEDPYKLLLDL